MANVHPLAPGQKRLLQRLLAHHTVTQSHAQKLYDQLEQDMDGRCQSLEQCFAQINSQLTQAFGLEIATVHMAVGSSGKAKRYHTIINQHADDVAKESFSQHYNKHDLAFVKLVMAQLVENRTCRRSDLINCRADLQEPYKLTAAGAEHCVETMLEEKWLVLSERGDASARESLKASVEIGPRSFLELSHMLADLGFPSDDMPQFLFHRE